MPSFPRLHGATTVHTAAALNEVVSAPEPTSRHGRVRAGCRQTLLILPEGLGRRGFWHWGPGAHPRRSWGPRDTCVTFVREACFTESHTMERARLLPFHFHELLSAYLIRFDVVRELIRRYFSDDIPHCGHYEPRANHASSFQKYSFGNDLFLFVLKW